MYILGLLTPFSSYLIYDRVGVSNLPGLRPVLALRTGWVRIVPGQRKVVFLAACRAGMPVLDSSERGLERELNHPS